MNIFTKDDYRKIQAWLKANAIKDSDLISVDSTIPEEDTLVLVQKINGILSNVKISIKNLLNSTLSKVIIDTIIANAVKVNNTLTVTASNVKIDNEKGITLQDIIDWTETIENVAKGWNIEYQAPSIDEPTVRAKYVLKDSKGVPKGDIIKVYKDSAITNVYLGTTEDTCNENTGEVTKKPVQNNNKALSIVYRLDTGKYSLVNIPIEIFIREAEFDKYRGLGITENGQVFIKLASDLESSNYLHFNVSGELSADGIENRILHDLGTIINSVANDGTMWGQYKKEEGTKDSPLNEDSRWGQYNKAEADRNEVLNTVSSKVDALFAGAKVSIYISPTTIYKNTDTEVKIHVQVSRIYANQITLFEDSVSGTIIYQTSLAADPIFSTVTRSKVFNLDSNSKTLVVQANYKNALFTETVVLNARYPIYRGFGSVYGDIVNNSNKLSARTSATGSNYKGTATADNQKYFILIPSDISVPTNYTMGGAPYVFSISTQTINNISYTVLTSGATYNIGASVDIILS